jgi:PKD repeat protein
LANYFEWTIADQRFVGREVTYTFYNSTYVYVAAYDTVGGNKRMVGTNSKMFSPQAPFNIFVSKDSICINGEISVSAGNISNIDFGDGFIADGSYVRHKYTKLGSFTITVKGLNSCKESFVYTKKIEVRDNLVPTPDFYLGKAEVCPEEPLSLSTNNSTSSSRYTWNFGDGTTSTKGYIRHSWTKLGTYNVSLTETNSCGLTRSITKEITVSAKNKITATWIHPSSKLACPNTKIDFYFNKDSYKSVLFDYGDNTTSSIITDNWAHSYVKPGRYFPKVTLTNYCNDDTTLFVDTIVIRSDLKWNSIDEFLSLRLPDSVCPSAPFEFYSNGRNALSYKWNFAAEGLSNEPAGMFSLKL